MSFNKDVRSDFESRTDSTVVTTNLIVVTSSTRANYIDHQFETLNRDDLVAVIEPMITVFYDTT